MHKPMEPQVMPDMSLAFPPLTRRTVFCYANVCMMPDDFIQCGHQGECPFCSLPILCSWLYSRLSISLCLCSFVPLTNPLPHSLSFCSFPFRKVQWSHLAALKNNASAPPVSRSHSFSDPVPSFAHLHLRSQEPHHPAHPARSEHPHPLSHSQSRSHEIPETSHNDEVPPKVRAGSRCFPAQSEMNLNLRGKKH